MRLLLDDNGIPSTPDGTLAALDAHSNIEVMLFKSFRIRTSKFVGFLTDSARLNHRMRNKSVTADGIATSIGGRNIDDEYFGATDDVATGIALVHSGYARRRVELLSGGVELFELVRFPDTTAGASRRR